MNPSDTLSALRQDILAGAYKKAVWRLIPFIFVCYLFNYLDRVNVASPSWRCWTRWV
ncbi:hypothetical protein [Chromobacterium haemolyticum]|uniref:hypothetical protein n=1 Tax=Chromobacterium haemolyticum TaxID=394935 RepID=UPI0019628E90|nr:hypothetical protein [Chromobacterium haemolyticum]